MRRTNKIKGRSIYKASLVLGLALFITLPLLQNVVIAQDIEQTEDSVQNDVYVCYFSPVQNIQEVLVNGKIDSITVIRSSRLEIDAEAIRLLKLSEPWKPATRINIPEACKMSIRIFPHHN